MTRARTRRGGNFGNFGGWFMGFTLRFFHAILPASNTEGS